MSAQVLLNSLNALGKSDKMRGMPSILFLFRNEFNKFINTGVRMLDSIYHMTIIIFSEIAHFIINVMTKRVITPGPGITMPP